MRAGVLIVGSLLWDQTERREQWRQSRLLMEGKVSVEVAIYYGRRSPSRGNTYTMTFEGDRRLGRAVLVPCRAEVASASGLIAEAQEVWRAESKSAKPGTVGASCRSVGSTDQSRTRIGADLCLKSNASPFASVGR